MAEIPRRVSLQPNGTYIWSAEVDMESLRKNYRAGGRICMTAALVFFVAGIIISLFYHNWHPFLYLTVFSIITSSHHDRCCSRTRRPGADKMYLSSDG